MMAGMRPSFAAWRSTGVSVSRAFRIVPNGCSSPSIRFEPCSTTVDTRPGRVHADNFYCQISGFLNRVSTHLRSTYLHSLFHTQFLPLHPFLFVPVAVDAPRGSLTAVRQPGPTDRPVAPSWRVAGAFVSWRRHTGPVGEDANLTGLWVARLHGRRPLDAGRVAAGGVPGRAQALPAGAQPVAGTLAARP